MEATSKLEGKETVAINQLLLPITDHTKPSEHGTINRDMTKTAEYMFEDILDDEKGMNATREAGSILHTELRVDDKLSAKLLMKKKQIMVS